MPGRAAHQEAAAAAAGGAEPTAAGGSAGAAAQQEQRGLAGAFPLVLKKLMENPPREARLGERGGGGSAQRSPASPPAPPSPFLPLAVFPPRASEGGTRRVTVGLAAVCGGASTRLGGRTPGRDVLRPPPAGCAKCSPHGISARRNREGGLGVMGRPLGWLPPSEAQGSDSHATVPRASLWWQ